MKSSCTAVEDTGCIGGCLIYDQYYLCKRSSFVYRQSKAACGGLCIGAGIFVTSFYLGSGYLIITSLFGYSSYIKTGIENFILISVFQIIRLCHFVVGKELFYVM